MSATLELAKQLIELPSISPEDAGCQKIISSRLASLGFRLEYLNFDDVT
ncbi:MAG TPA: succinyl-diaminopimelate desuccinylase, partial [Gammaproteobacteria bacterium]|nr:succinyl-diaminopimelate desuccinylase [Gammaproteobacteria bacterium]